MPLNFGNIFSFQDFSNIFFNFGAALAGFWALYQWRVRRRTDAARWMQELFDRFYVDEKFTEGRDLIEYDFAEITPPLVSMRVTDRDINLTYEERKNLEYIDKLLNYLEHLIYLEEVGNIKRSDRLVFFEH